MSFLEAMGSSGGGGSSGPFGLPSVGQMAFSEHQNQQASWQADHAMDRADADQRLQMSFQERMSNTAYQRATEDMKKAGINPMLAYMQGGASSPSGGSGTGGIAAPVQNIGSGAIASAFDAARLSNELKNSGSQRVLNDAVAAKATADAATAGSTAKLTDTRNDALKSQLNVIKKRSDYESKKLDYDQKALPFDAINSRVGAAANSANALKSLINPFSSGGSSGAGKGQGQLKDGTVFDLGTGEIQNP